MLPNLFCRVAHRLTRAGAYGKHCGALVGNTDLGPYFGNRVMLCETCDLGTVGGNVCGNTSILCVESGVVILT